MIVTEFKPNLPFYEPVIVSGGRVHSIAVNPTNSNHIIAVNRFGGLWKTEDGGSTWFHLDRLLTIFARDAAYSPDGNTVIATVERDNRVENGGGIWVSHDGGSTWNRPKTGDPHNHSKLPHKSWINKRISAYGVCYSPDDPKKVYVGTDYGIAVSDDNGNTWSHKMLEEGSPGWNGYIYGEKSVMSLLALPKNRAIALCNTGVYMTEQKFEKGKIKSWTSSRIYDGDFSFFGYESCKNIDVSPFDNDKIFIVKDYQNLLLYEVKKNKWTTIPTTTHCPDPYWWDWNDRRGPFVKIAKSSASDTSFDIWLGSGMNLNKVTCKDIDSVKTLKKEDWIQIHSPGGLHADTGHIGLNGKKLPILYGCDGGLFRPDNDECTKWTRVPTNSLLISDMAGTNVSTPKHTCLYMSTQDNMVWGSGDGGYTWPNYNDSEGFHVQVIKRAEKDEIIRVGFGTTDGPNNFSKAHLVSPIPVPNRDTDGNELTDLHQAYFIRSGEWIRMGKPKSPIPEIYVSKDNGEKWQKLADVELENRGLNFTVSSFPAWWEDVKKPRTRPGPIVYVPFKGMKTNPDGSERIGLIRLDNIFASWGDKKTTARKYNESDLIYIGNKSGSLGVRFTDFDWHPIFGVDPHDPHFIIAPDVYNNKIMISQDGGLTWNTDYNLTKEVTKNNTLLLYDGSETRLQVTCISFDPYNWNRIYIGTRDSGIIYSLDAGRTWSTIPNSEKILYVTNIFFEPHGDTLIISTYGRGLWKILTWGAAIPFPAKLYCARSGCTIRWLPSFELMTGTSGSIDWIDNDVIVFLNGKANGIIMSGLEIKKISVTKGTRLERYVGNTQNIQDIRIVESEQGEGFVGLEDLLRQIKKSEIIKGIILKENQLIGIICGKTRFQKKASKLIKKNSTSSKRNYGKIENKINSLSKKKKIGFSRPYLFIKTKSPTIYPHAVGNDGIIDIHAKGFKFHDNKHDQIKMIVDSQPINATGSVQQDGNVEIRIKIPPEIPNGIHHIKLIQKTEQEILEGVETFVKVGIDEFEHTTEENSQVI